MPFDMVANTNYATVMKNQSTKNIFHKYVSSQILGATLSENCSLLGTDNVRGQISWQINAPNKRLSFLYSLFHPLCTKPFCRYWVLHRFEIKSEASVSINDIPRMFTVSELAKLRVSFG